RDRKKVSVYPVDVAPVAAAVEA
ncbi:50S ribosomal protein L27, partial [Clostridium perfringens]